MNGEEYKIKSLIPYLMDDILVEDASGFNISMNMLCNKIFTCFHKKPVSADDTPMKEKTRQFKLNKVNSMIYEEIRLNDVDKIENRSRFFRNMVRLYCDNPSYKRERMIFEKEFKAVQNAVKNRSTLMVEYRDKDVRRIEPYAVLPDKERKYNYIFGWCCKHGEHRNYRLSNIKPFNVDGEPQTHRDEEYIESIKKHFDAFLSFGMTVKVKFTDTGRHWFEDVIFLNKPVVLDREGDVYTLECSMRKAKVYFPAFLDEVEILEPVALREYFRKKAGSMKDIYAR